MNGNDLKSQILARYFFEHMFLASFTFADRDDANRFIMVRSSTPPGEDAKPVVEKGAANFPVEGPVYYRFIQIDETTCVKMSRLQFLASDEKMQRFQEIFAEEEWSVDALPGYTEEERHDPLGTFSAIPPKSRYKFLLDIVWYHRGFTTHGPGCYRDLATDALRDVGWDLYENPETSLYVTDAEYRAEIDPLMSMMGYPLDPAQFVLGFQAYQQRRAKAAQKALERRAASGDSPDLTDIWQGDDADDLPLTVAFIHGDSGYVVEGNWVPSHLPKVVSIQDLTTMEMSLYGSAVNYNQFGSGEEQLAGRSVFGVQRTLAELNFIRFLPKDVRQSLFDEWYHGPLTKQILATSGVTVGPDTSIPTGIEYTTNDPVRELQEKILSYLGDRVNAVDPINRPVDGDGGDDDPVIRAMRTIVFAGSQQEPTWRKFKTLMPEVSFIRVNRSGQEPDIYTMTHDRDFESKSFLNIVMQHENPANAKVSIMKGIYTSYPHFIFDVDENEIEEFSATFIEANTQDKMTAIVERWGVRRSSPDFCRKRRRFSALPPHSS